MSVEQPSPVPAMARLASLLGRPEDSFPALRQLGEPAQAALLAAIEASCREHDRRLDTALARALPGPLKRLLSRPPEAT